MQPRTKRRLTYFIFGAYYMMGGIEYAVIMPTLFLYIETAFQAETYYMGMILSAYSISGLFSGPIMGRLADNTRKPKILLMVCGFFMIAGSTMYWVGLSVNFLVLSRLVQGCGAGFEPIIIGELARSSTEAERTGIIALLVGVRQLGLMMGPVFNIFLREADFMIGCLPVNKYNVAGAFMALVWCLVLVLAIFLYYDLDKIQEERRSQDGGNYELKDDIKNINMSVNEKQEQDNYTGNTHNTANHEGHGGQNSFNGKIVTYYNSVDAIEQSDSSFEDNTPRHYDQLEGKFILSESEDANDDVYLQDVSSFKSSTQDKDTAVTKLDYGTMQSIEDNKEEKKMETLSWKMIIDEILRDEVVAVVFASFSCAFAQIGMEAITTPLTNRLLGWGELENSIFYTFGGIQTMMVFFLVRWLSKFLQDRTLLCIGSGFLIAAICWWMYALPYAALHPPNENLPRFLVGTFLHWVGFPIEIACSSSLFSKLMRKEIQGFSQGLNRSMRGIALILGPLWAGSTLQWPYLMLGVILAMFTISMIMVLLSWPRLRSTSEIQKEEMKKLVEP